MSILTQEQITNIRNSVDIVDVIGSYIPLTQRGRNYFGVCPFHDDHSPSMSVSKEKQIYTCFSCHATGNVFNFLMDYDHLSFVQAVIQMANKAGIKVDVNSNTKEEFNNNLYNIYEISSKFYQNNINTPEGKNARAYLERRDISSEIIKEFEIGLALKEKDILTKLLIKKSFDLKDLIKSGLVSKNELGYNDVYYNRIMFPLYDLNGRIVGYSGRIFNDEDTSKYINTKETEIFKKGELLYNYHRAKDAARSEQTIIIMEGFMDVIRAHTIGIKNVVATMGTAVTKNQANLIKKMAKNIILCFDGDEAGQKATYACSNELLAMGITPNIVYLDENLDPDEYIKKYGKDKFTAKIKNPLTVVDFMMQYLKNNKDLTNNIDLAKYVNEIVRELSNIEDDVLRELSLNKISKEANLDIDFLRNKIEKKENKILPEKKEIEIKLTKYEKAEKYLLYYMLRSTDVVKMYNKKITYLPSEKYRNLAKQINNYIKENNNFEMADFISFLEDKNDLIKLIGEIEGLNLKENYSQEEIDDYIDVILEYNINYATNRLKEKMLMETDPMKKAQIGQEIINLKIRRENNDK